jgi:predicted methyltransferase
MHNPNSIGRLLVAGFTALMLASAANAQAQGPKLSPLGEQIKAAIDAEHRTDADRARDKNRKPIETLEFFQLRADMKVLELLPGGGWYTKILAPVLREKGDFAVSMFGGRVVEQLKDVPGFDKLRVVGEGMDPGAVFGSERVNNRFQLPEFSFDEGSFDLILTFRNLHNFTPEGREHMNAAVLEALAPGGLYGVVDHTRRHMQADHNEVWRRMDPVKMIHELEAAGFEFVDWSDLHYRADDELRYEVGRATVTGNTDRFTLLFRKPAKR